MEKWISIIIPCYNVENYLDRCMKSIVSQTIGIEHLEVILVDDASQDGTWGTINLWEKQYPDSVIAVQCEINSRQGGARNIGMQYASTPYIGFVDSDDWVEPEMYEKMLEKVLEQKTDIVMCRNWRDFGREDQKLAPKRTADEDKLYVIDTAEKRKQFLAQSIMGFGVWDKLYKRSFLLENEIFFPENLAYEDHYFGTLLYFYAERIYLIEERFYHYYVNNHSTVLTSGGSHHFDILTVDTMLWAECERRGLLEEYRMEMEYQFLCLCYLASVKMMLLRLDEIPYEYLHQLKKETLKRVPNYRNNVYVAELVTQTNKVVLELLGHNLLEEEEKVFLETLRRYVREGNIVI